MMSLANFISFAVVSVIAAHCLLGCAAQTPGPQPSVVYYELDSPPTDLQVSPFDGSIVVSAGQKLHFLNMDFSPNSSVITHDRQEVYRIALSYDTSDVVLACKDAYCTHYDIDWMYQEFFTSKTVGRGYDSVPLSLDPDGFYIATTDTISMTILQIDQDGNTIRTYAEVFKNDNFYRRQFLYGFQLGDFVYYVVRDNGTLSSNNVRIMRLCHDTKVFTFHAAYEAVLECSPMSTNSRVEVSHSLMDEFGNAVITVSVTTDHETNMCLFDLESINFEMDRSYALCSSGDNNTLTIPLVWHNQHTCSILSLLTENQCDFNQGNHINAIPALAAFDPVRGRHLLRFNNSEEITAILTAQVGITTITDLLYVALSTSQGNHFLDKYHITDDGESRFVSREPYSLPITLLRWNELMQEMYGGNVNSVFGIPLERCSNYTSCSECTGSGDPLCGWCTLGQHCSQSIDCPRSSHTGHWVNNKTQCIASVSLSQASMDVDLIQSVHLTVVPAEASLPSSPPQGYQCSFYNGSIENTSYSLRAPFTDGACQLQQAQIDTFQGTHIDLNFQLQLGNSTTKIFPTSSVLALHNCSLHTDCLSCVEANEVCGWCVHDRICTGNPTNCRHEDDWRTIDEDGVCPVVITPDHGSYTLPVAVRRDIILSTFNIPAEIPGYEYGCQIKYGNGSVVGLEAEYYNHTEFRCLTEENQVHMSAHVTNGSETTQLEILWLRSSDNFFVVLHTIKMTLYDCKYLGSDCSSCLSANIGTGFDCIWCDRLNTPDTCTVLDHCKIESTLFNDIVNCPLPTITGVSPVSGPTLGGTLLTVTGTNLGAVAGDVTVELVKSTNQVTDEKIPCLVDPNGYIPGSRIVCTTSEASEGDHLVSVSVRRGSQMARPRSLPTFTFAHPIINSVEPQQGPKAGGTYIVFQGSNLDISSDGVAKVFIGEVPCDIQDVTPTMISCISRAVPSASEQQRTRIVIDNADMPSELYSYTENPEFARVEPQYIIPAGGVTLTFRGRHLNVVLQPELRITINNNTLTGVCTPRSSTTLKCTAPKLPDATALLSNSIKRRTASSDIIDYTVKMDWAEGPTSDSPELQIAVKPDPVFHMVHMDDKQYTLESGRSIRILGSNIDSVLPSEISVVVDEAACTLVKNDVTDTQIRCFPPDTVLPGDRLVKVYIGKSSLNYSVGFLRYSKASSKGGSNNDLLLIIIPALAGVIILMLTLLAMLCCSIGVLVRRKRAYKAKRRSTALHEEDKNEVALVPVFPNMYNGNRHTVGEHDYDTIPDVLDQMQIQQLQQMEMITCAAQHGIPLTDIETPSPAKCKSNIYYSEDEGRGSSAGSSNKSSSRPSSASLSGGSRPQSVSTTGSLSYKNVKRPPLPPLPKVVTCSGYGRNGSLRLVRSGVGINEQASIDLAGVKGVWSLHCGSAMAEGDNTLVIAFVGQTTVLSLKGEEVEETELEGIAADQQTHHCSNVIGDKILQITGQSVRLINEETLQLISKWSPPSGKGISAGSCAGSHVVVVVGNELFCLDIQESDLTQLSHVTLDHEIACVDVRELKGETESSLICAVGLWTNISAQVLRLPSLNTLHTQPLGGDILPRSILVASFSSRTYLLVALGDGTLHYFQMDPDTGTLTNGKKVVLGTKPIVLRQFMSGDTCHVFACSNHPTIIHWNNHKLLFSNVNLKEVNYICTLNSDSYKDCLALVDDNTLTIGSLDQLQMLHIHTVPLAESPRRISHQEVSHTFLVACCRVDVPNGDKTALVPPKPCASKSVPNMLEGTHPDDLSILPVTTTEELEVYSLLLFDENSLEVIHGYQLAPREHVVSLTSCVLDSTHYYVVGTAFVDPTEKEPNRGRVFLFRVSHTKVLELVYTHEEAGAVYQVVQFQDKLLISVNSEVRLYKWEEGKMVLECSFADTILALYLKCKGDFILVGDLMRSFKLLVYKAEKAILEEISVETSLNPVFMTAMEMIDDENYLGADGRHIFVCQKNSEASVEADLMYMLQPSRMYIGDNINVFRHGSLVMEHPGASPSPIQGKPIIYGSVHGAVGLIAQLDMSTFSTLAKLQENMATAIKSVGNIEHEVYRCFAMEHTAATKTKSAEGFIDGDLVEHFLDLPQEKMEQICKGIKRSDSHGMEVEVSVEDVVKLIEDLSRIH